MTDPALLTEGYNQRLFARPGLRSFYHLARFHWAERQVREHFAGGLKVIELGCFDGRLLDHIGPCVAEYVGLDANWEGGLDLARDKFARNPDVTFIEASAPAALRQFPDGHFDLAVSLETLEHLPPELLPEFLDELRRVTSGRLLVTVPNELGPVFLAKYLLKRVRYGATDPYTPREFIAAVLGRSERIARQEHKGFDFRRLIGEIRERFEIVGVTGLPRLSLPPSLSATVAIHAKSRRED